MELYEDELCECEYCRDMRGGNRAWGTFARVIGCALLVLICLGSLWYATGSR